MSHLENASPSKSDRNHHIRTHLSHTIATGTGTATVTNTALNPPIPIKVTCLVKANDTSEENVIHSDRLGLRFRHILNDASQTVASFTKSIMEENEFVKYVQAVCQEFTNHCNGDITLCYGDEKRTMVRMRYMDEPFRSTPVMKQKLMMFVRLVERSDAQLSSTVIRAKESIYNHISLCSSSQVQEVYIAPSSCSLYDLSNQSSSDDETIILMSVKSNQVQMPVEINPTRKRIQEFTSHDLSTLSPYDDDDDEDDDDDSFAPKDNSATSLGVHSNAAATTTTVKVEESKSKDKERNGYQHELLSPHGHKRRRKIFEESKESKVVSKQNGGHMSKESTRINSQENKKGKSFLPNLIGEKVMKHFEGYGDYCGKVVAFDANARWYTVRYEDGDEEQMSFDDVIKHATFYRSNELIPGTADMSGSFYSSLSDDTPGKIAKKVGCEIKSLLELNTMRLTKTKHGLKSTSKVWEKTIFFLPDDCDMSKLQLLWGKQTADSYKSIQL